MVSMVTFSFGPMFRNLRVRSVLIAAAVTTSFGPMFEELSRQLSLHVLEVGVLAQRQVVLLPEQDGLEPPGLREGRAGAVSPNDRASSNDFLRVAQVVLAGNSLTFRN